MRLTWTERGWQDYLYWQQMGDKILKRINELIRDTERHPFQGIGKPEPLRNEMSGWWSRRINHEHRLVYRVSGKADTQALEITACRFHYGT
ncbi:addiction module protein (plasmid) [Phyllobacterium zundukense]|uniref:Txe/YoeB family addiction module toxin n=1 Tax=Phyllobacterium zundukense TaxID=1867719 RepID=UPI000C1C7D85|nr:Txe/YoeB family addiction module toxin [Phyllobacterium zundukense]ATU95929.1 addiction module protein [Phyllobacterium zundukense]